MIKCQLAYSASCIMCSLDLGNNSLCPWCLELPDYRLLVTLISERENGSSRAGLCLLHFLFKAHKIELFLLPQKEGVKGRRVMLVQHPLHQKKHEEWPGPLLPSSGGNLSACN